MTEKGDKVKLLSTSGKLYSYYYKLGDTIDCYYSSLVPSTGYIKKFNIVKYYDGLLLQIPNRNNPEKIEELIKQDKMLEVFQEHHRWNEILGISTVGDFNIACNEGHAIDLINVSEALQERKIVKIADEISARQEGQNRIKLILISGPSSSGKTTFSKRLSIQLMTNGLKPYPISLAKELSKLRIRSINVRYATPSTWLFPTIWLKTVSRCDFPVPYDPYKILAWLYDFVRTKSVK